VRKEEFVHTSLPGPSTYPISVKGVVLDSSDRVLLVKNERAEWELPGGRIEIGESPEECVAREIYEESRWKVSIGAILGTWMYYINAVQKNVFIVTYGCHSESDSEPVLSHEHSEINLFTLSEVDRLRIPDGYRRSIAAWFIDPRRGSRT